MSARHNLPLYLKLAAPVLVLAVLFATFVHAYWGPQLLASQRALLIEREQDVIRNVAPTLQIDLMAADFGAIFETLARLERANVDEGLSVALFSPDGRRLYPLGKLAAMPVTEGHIEVRQTIEDDARVLGEIVVALDISGELAEVRERIATLENLLLLAAVGVLILAVLSYYWLIGKPMAALAGVAARLGAGDFTVDVPRRAREGTGALGEALVKMRDALRDTRAELDLHAAELAASLVRYRTVQESMPGALLVVDAQGRIEDYSGAAQDIFGHRREDMVGRSCEALFPDPDCRHALTQAVALAGDQTQESEQTGQHADGHIVPLRVFYRTMEVDGQLRMVVIALDVSRIKAAEKRLLAAKEEAERANQAKTNFLSRMSHELRTPMNAILGFGQLLAMDPALEQGEPRESLNEILRAGEHLLKLINEVLDLSRIEIGKLAIESEPIPLDECILRAIAQVRPLAQSLGLTIEAPPVEGHPLIHADRTRLMQVLLNLLSNAAKYNRSGGWIRLSAVRRSAPERWRIEVEDSGIGIAEADLARIFDPFERINAHQHAIEGAGIGLALTKQLVEAMGGCLGADSRLGEGSRFWVELPVGPASPPGAEGDADADRLQALADGR